VAGRDKKLPIRALVVICPTSCVVTPEGNGINNLMDLKGKRLSTGAPSGGTVACASRGCWADTRTCRANG
jgi:TRAP-type uncharacterized transport system substrate-binding protein